MFWRRLTVMLLIATSCVAASAADDRAYSNARFGYSVTIPARFGNATEADDGDGVTVRPIKGDAELRIWGSFIQARSFREEAAASVAADGQDGWRIAYQRIASDSASWSGTRKGRILYVRAIQLCEEASGTLRLEYAAKEKALYDRAIERLVKGFRSIRCG